METNEEIDLISEIEESIKHNIHPGNFASISPGPIAEIKKCMLHLHHFKESSIMLLSLVAAKAVNISDQQATTGKKNFNHAKYVYND